MDETGTLNCEGLFPLIRDSYLMFNFCSVSFDLFKIFRKMLCQNTYTYPLRLILFYVNSFIFKWDLIKLIFLLPRLDRHQLIEQILKFQLTTTLLCSLSCESCSPEKILPREKEKSLKRAEKKREKRYTSFLDLRVSRSPFAFRYRLATPSPFVFSLTTRLWGWRGGLLSPNLPQYNIFPESAK